MNNRLRNTRQSRPVDIPLPNQAQPPASSWRYRPWVIPVIILTLLCLVVTAGGGYYLYNRDATPTQQTDTPFSPPSNSGAPAQQVNTAVPGAPREVLNVCIVNFGPYLPVLTIENTNQANELSVIPLNFYETVEQLDAGQFMNEAGESQQIQALADGTCDILFTTLDVLSKHPGMGKLIAVIGQSDGADKTVAWNYGVTPQCQGKPINIFNDLQGCVFAVAEDSVGYYQALGFLKLSNILKNQVTINTYPTPDEAVAACLAYQADVCSGWVPTIDDMIIEGQTKVLVDSRFQKTIYDGIFVSPQADQLKQPAISAFLRDWFGAVKLTQEDLAAAGQRIAAWTYNGMSTNEYTFVYPGSEYDDMVLWLEPYAQAGFGSHYVFQANPDVLYDILKTGRTTWEWSEQTLDGGFEPASMVNLNYFGSLSARNDLNSQSPFINNTFSAFPAQSDQPATREQLIALPTLVEVVCPNVFFRPGKVNIPTDSAEYTALLGCGEQIRTLMNQSNVQILIVGSAAWPDPAVFGSQYAACGTFQDNDYCYGVAKNRASFALGVFTGQLHLPGNRFAIDYRLGEKTSDQAVLQDNRFVTIQVKAGGLE